jgi:hypothetical protein
MEISKPYTLTLVDTDVDFIVIKNPYCIRCFTRKMNCNILSKYLLIKNEAQEFISYKVRAVRIICECNKK